MKTLPVLLVSLIVLHLFLSSTSPPIVEARPLQPIVEGPDYERASPANRAPTPGFQKCSILEIILLRKLFSPIQYAGIHFSFAYGRSFGKWFSKMESVERADDSIASLPDRAPPPRPPMCSFEPIRNLIQKLSEKLSQYIGSASA